MKRYGKAGHQQGATMVETLFALPIVLMVGLGIVYIGLVYQVRANLEYAALMAARVGSVTSIDTNQMIQEAAKRMAASAKQVAGGLPVPPPIADFRIEILNPTVAMFQACGVVPADAADCAGNNCQIPNFGLQFRPDQDCDGVNIQDANLLRIKVYYLYDSSIPFFNRIFASEPGGGMWVSAVSTVRMQTPARYTTSNFDKFN